VNNLFSALWLSRLIPSIVDLLFFYWFVFLQLLQLSRYPPLAIDGQLLQIAFHGHPSSLLQQAQAAHDPQ
jgi:hypothetical protein